MISIKLSKCFEEILFQIGALYVYSQIYEKQITLPDASTFIQNTKLFNDVIIDKYYELSDKDEQHSIIPFGMNIMLRGKFRTFKKYQENTIDFMRNFIYSNEDYMYAAYKKYNDIKASFGIDNDDMVSLYFDNDINMAYYKKSVILMNKTNIVVFAENSNPQLMQIFDKCHNVQVIWEDNVYVRFILLSFFKHNIVQYYDPYFSLWAAFISKYDDIKTVIVPYDMKKIVNENISNVNVIYLD